MNTVEILRPSTTYEIYDPDDVGPRDSPQLQPMTYNLVPSPSPPPAVPLPPLSPESSPEPEDGRKGSARSKPRPSQGDAVLIAFMADGKYNEIASDAGKRPLASEIEEEESPVKGGTDVVVVSTIEDKEDTMVAAEELVAQNNAIHPDTLAAMQTLAADALRQTARQSPEEAALKVELPPSPKLKVEPPQTESEPMDGVKATSVPSITTLLADGPSPASHLSPERRHDTVAPSPVAAGELPPIRHHSPQSSLTNGNGPSQITLPSIIDQLGDINHLAESAATGESPFAQSPPGRPPPRFSAVPGHGSPPKSPNEMFRNQQLPSPGRGQFYPTFPNGNRRHSQSNGEPQYPSPNEYSGSNTETPASDQSGSTPSLSGMNRMSIEGITNPQIGGFQCTNQGCTAQPFQTQYLLNSHANVHSQNRPHYCSVKGCPRSEGGKGFKRKNEMIRHGLVHDSPGYICPFCPDREHKYPRPDNLQRHVKVHHVDKDKDDAQLRDVLSQRPEGPSRGRRRRGGTS